MTSPALPGTHAPLGASGLKVSPLWLGTMMFGDRTDEAEAARIVDASREAGINAIDTADVYVGGESERITGRLISPDRERWVLATKLANPTGPGPNDRGLSRRHMLRAVDASLQRLGTDWIDVLYLHREDRSTPMEETLMALADLIRSGKVHHFGVSNHSPSQLALLHRRVPLCTNQIEFSPLHLAPLSDGTLDQCVDLELRPMIWSPLAGGRLLTSDDARTARVRGVLEALAREHEVSVPTIAYAWLLRHPSRPVPVTGTGRVEGLREAVAALGVTLSAESWYRVWEASAGHPVP